MTKKLIVDFHMFNLDDSDSCGYEEMICPICEIVHLVKVEKTCDGGFELSCKLYRFEEDGL